MQPVWDGIAWRERSRLVHAWRRWRTRNPRTFEEKVRYKMLRDHRPLLVTFADKAAVRDYVAQTVGAQYLPDCYAILDDPAALRTLALPPCYVVKPTHGSGAVVAVTADAPPDARLPDPGGDWQYSIVRPDAVHPDQLEALCASWMRRLHGHGPNFEWAYSYVRPRLLVEEFLRGPDGAVPDDYKLHVFHGRCHWVQVDRGRFGRHTQDHFDVDWNLLPFTADLPRSSPQPARPGRLPQMIEVAQALGQQTDYVRVDLYDLPDRIVFGELTSYPGAGAAPFYPPSWDLEYGRPWRVPSRYRR